MQMQSPGIKRSILFIASLLVLAITFETLQQLYYIRRYDLVDGITFVDVLQGQSYRWLIWMLLGMALVPYAKKGSGKSSYSFSKFAKFGLFIAALVVINIVVISILEMLISGEGFAAKLFVNEYFPFYIYQKAPIYTLGYIAVAVILHLYFANEQLQIKVQELHELKETHAQLYDQLRTRVDDRTRILSIKLGNKRRIIPVSDIVWIEADDYCVKVHTLTDTHTMRSSLKALEEKLDGNFLRVHRRAIVNMDCTQELRLTKNPTLVLSNQEEVLVSKSQLKSVREFLA